MKRRQPDFGNVLKLLKRQQPSRDTLFEFFLNWDLYVRYAGAKVVANEDAYRDQRVQMHGFFGAGYDYATVMPGGPKRFYFPQNDKHREQTISLNDADTITDQASFEAYRWVEPDACDYSVYEKLAAEVPAGGKLIAFGPGGVLENVIGLVGFERLCIMTMMEPQLAQAIFSAVGSRLVRYYEIVSAFPSVGACISNDDWGYKTQTMLSPEDMRRYVFPWHRKIVAAIHASSKPAILHSCGNLEAVMDDIIDDMEYDAKHSYEDAIMPVEDAYERWGKRIATVGGIDLDFLVRSDVAAIAKRSRAMLDRAAARGGYGLGSGNSIPAYVPVEKYEAMIRVAVG